MYVPIIHKQLKHQQQTASRSGEPSVIAYKGNLALSNEQLRTQDNSFADQRALCINYCTGLSRARSCSLLVLKLLLNDRYKHMQVSSLHQHV